MSPRAPKGTVLIEWTPEMFERLKQRHQQAVETKETTFTFDGHALETNYAKYLIEHLATAFAREDKKGT